MASDERMPLGEQREAIDAARAALIRADAIDAIEGGYRMGCGDGYPECGARGECGDCDVPAQAAIDHIDSSLIDRENEARRAGTYPLAQPNG